MADENEAQTAALAHVASHCERLGRDARALAAVACGFRAGAAWAQEQRKDAKRPAEPSPASSPEARAFANWLRTSAAAPSCTINGHDACWADAIRWERERWQAALKDELARVSDVSFPARPLVEHFLEEVRKRLGIP